MCAGAPGSEPGAAGGRRPYLEVRASPDGRDPTTLPRRHPRAWGTHIRPLEATRHVALRARSVLLEGGHRKPRLHELLAVELGGLPGAPPDDRLARVVDPVREPVALVDTHPRDHPGERLRDVVKGVVIVVQHDHHPVAPQARARTPGAETLQPLHRYDLRPTESPSPPMDWGPGP